MIRIAALNEEKEEESESEIEVTREALEQIALQQYAKALDLHRKGNLTDATQLLKDLLDTELLYDVRKPAQGETTSSPLLNLKYLCYKNLAKLFVEDGEIEAAIESYLSASELDDTDVTLWHRLGLLCLQAKHYEMALDAFHRGIECNPRHWPSLDNIVKLLLALGLKEECIITIHDTLELDPDYLRGLVYRKHIYTAYPYIRRYMESLNPIYKWSESNDEFDEAMSEKLIKEAQDIRDIFVEQKRAQEIKYVIPELKLMKPITHLSWESVGESLLHMHHYMTDNGLSHASRLEIVFEKEQDEAKEEEPMEVCEEPNEQEDIKPKENSEPEKTTDNGSENDNNDLSDKEKAATDSEKVESDIEMVPAESTDKATTENTQEPKKKTGVRRRGSDLNNLRQWGWYYTRRSGRKKENSNKKNKQDCDDNIYDILRKMVPLHLSPEMIQKKENKARETSPDTRDLEKLFDEKGEKKDEKCVKEEYFGTENEQKDVRTFINKYTENKCDIIDILKEFLIILAAKWKVKWPEKLPQIFVGANKCYNNHIDVPAPSVVNRDELLHYTAVNILVEEFDVNQKLNSNEEEKPTHELNVIEAIAVTLSQTPNIFDGTDYMELIIRHLWVKLHIHLLNKCEDFALDCLYQLTYEFESMGAYHDVYSLEIVNFSFKPTINEQELTGYIKFLQRNKRLSTVMDLYDEGEYEKALSIILDSFEYSKSMTKKEEEESSLDFAAQIALILDSYWCLEKPGHCLKWAFIGLHEALKHFFRHTSGSPDHKKWSQTILKIVCCLEHIFTTEGLLCLEAISDKELSQGLEDLIRVIGHQVETNSEVTDMPFDTIVPWIILHYIFLREETHGSSRMPHDKEMLCDEIPNSLMILFIAHEFLGAKGWCSKSDCKLLYFTLDTVVPLLRLPSLAKSLEQIGQYMEQCVYCLFGHPSKKNNKIRYLDDHKVTAKTLDWPRAQQVYEIFRPPILPEFDGKLSGITGENDLLFRSILKLLPAENDPQKYLPEVEKYILGTENKLPRIPQMLPFKMRDIYFLLGDHYFKKDDRKLAVKYNSLDLLINNDRVAAWAEISLTKAANLGIRLNSCRDIHNEKEYLKTAKSTIKCFKRALDIDPSLCNLWIEYGNFVYSVHSFCSRLLKQASESLSMDEFESLEKQKEDMLDITQKCFTMVYADLHVNDDSEKPNEDSWLLFYMLGKVAEKRNKPPSIYLKYYMQAVKTLADGDATYPLKINSSASVNLCIEVLEIHYRIHASILKYIEQHENKPIPGSVGTIFRKCIEDWKNGPFSKKPKKDAVNTAENELKPTNEPTAAANILKRSISDAGEDGTHEMKKLKLESAAAKVRRSASYDTERISKDISSMVQLNDPTRTVEDTAKTNIESEVMDVESPSADINISETQTNNVKENPKSPPVTETETVITENSPSQTKNVMDSELPKKPENSSSTSSSSSSDSSSSDSTSDSSDSTGNSDASTKSIKDKPLSEEETMNIVSSCLEALEDCASRFLPHYKAIYRLAHYHFYYKKGKDLERCRDLMLLTCVSKSGQKLNGLFSEKKPSNFFNNIWKIPIDEVDRPGSFSFHMNRCVLLTMEILKQIDDHKTLLELSIHLNRIPEPDKTYLRNPDREDLAQQAFSLCVQSLKGQLLKFSQQSDLKSNEVEQQALKSLMLDIYKAYQKVPKHPNSKQFSNLLVDAYKLITTNPINENMNLVDLSLKYCHSIKTALKHQQIQASIEKSQNQQKKQAAKAAESLKATSTAASQSKQDTKAKPDKVPATQTPTTSSAALPRMSQNDISAAFQSYLPMLNDTMLNQQAQAALSYLSTLTQYPAYQNSLQASLQSSLQNSFQAEFYLQFLGQTLSSYLPPPKKKRGPKPGSTRAPSSQIRPSKSFTATPVSSMSKPVTSVSSLQKSTSLPLAPSMGTVLSTLPPSMSANLSSFGATHSSAHNAPAHAHMPKTSTSVSSAIHSKPPMPHQQTSPGKTLQEKLAERQKNIPTSKSSGDINASLGKLPSSLSITKSAVNKSTIIQGKKPDAKKFLPFSEAESRPKPISSDEIIILDDD